MEGRFINEADISSSKDNQELSGNQQYTLETAQKNLKKDLQFLAKQRKQFSSVLEKMGQGVLLLNKTNEVLFYNKTIKEDFWPEIEIGSKFFSNVSYPSFKKFLKKESINAELIKINGSVELTPYIGIADCICDLVSSGATLEANNLTEFKTLMDSEAVLISSSILKNLKEKSIINLVRRFEGVINAAESKYVMLNASTDSVNKICKLLPGADSPTIIPLQEKNKVAIHALCSEPVFWETMEKLKSNGASSILVMPVEKILN